MSPITSHQDMHILARIPRNPADYVCVFVSAGIRAKVENQGQYDEYLEELRPIREELGINLKENMYPDNQGGARVSST